MNKLPYKRIAYIGLMAALTFICTSYISLRVLPNGAYLHAGNIIIVIASCLFGPMFGGLSAMIGSAFADLFFAPQWTIFTVIIKFAMGYLIGAGFKMNDTAKYTSYAVVGIVFVGGYYIAEAVLFGNWAAPVVNITPHALEYVISLIVGLIISKKLIPYKLDKFID